MTLVSIWGVSCIFGIRFHVWGLVSSWESGCILEGLASFLGLASFPRSGVSCSRMLLWACLLRPWAHRPFRIDPPLQVLPTPSGFIHPFRFYPPPPFQDLPNTFRIYPPLHNLPTPSGFTHPFRIYPPLQNLPTPSGFLLFVFHHEGQSKR